MYAPAIPPIAIRYPITSYYILLYYYIFVWPVLGMWFRIPVVTSTHLGTTKW